MKERLIELVKQEVKEKYGEKYKVEVNKVLKNNNLVLDAICILCKAGRVAPNIYINELLESIEDNMITVEDAAKKVIDIYEKNKDKVFSFLDDISYKENVYIQVVNREKNEARLKEVIHKDFLNLSIIYRIMIERTSDGITSMVVNDNLLNKMNITKEELHNIAVENTSKDNFKAISMKTVMKKLMIESMGGVLEVIDDEENEDPYGMYVIGGSACWGSACLYTLDGIKELSNKVENDLYILPSSIHEVIAIPYYTELKVEDLKDMVCQININEVPDEDILSDSVYYYDRQEEKLKML